MALAPTPRTETQTLRISPVERRAIEKLAIAHERSAAAEIRFAIKEHIAKHTSPQPRSTSRGP